MFKSIYMCLYVCSENSLYNINKSIFGIINADIGF